MKFVAILKSVAAAGGSMRFRLLSAFLSLVACLLLAAGVVLALIGVIPSAEREIRDYVTHEMENIASEIERSFGTISVQAVLLSESLSRSVELRLADSGYLAEELGGHPELLEEILTDELNRLLLALEKTKCSGVFVVLDATVNPALSYAERSRAGLYIRNTEPSVPGTDTKLFLRGFPRIALANGLSLQSGWDMEFDVEGREFFELPMHAAGGDESALPRLYLWSGQGAIAGLDEHVMTVSVPLLDGAGNTFGVCGFEVSEMYFKLNFAPDPGGIRRISCALTAFSGDRFETAGALYSGSDVWAQARSGNLVAADQGPLRVYRQEQGVTFVGAHRALKLYPADSVFKEREFAAALMLPKEDLDNARMDGNLRLALTFMLLLCFGAALSVMFSRSVIRPFLIGLSALKGEGEVEKTNIQEIDEILDALRAMRPEKSVDAGALFEEFIGRISALTPAERTIFKLCANDTPNDDILGALHISLSTLKTHYRHMYAKLGVSSRDELALYIQLIRKSGRESDIL